MQQGIGAAAVFQHAVGGQAHMQVVKGAPPLAPPAFRAGAPQGGLAVVEGRIMAMPPVVQGGIGADVLAAGGQADGQGAPVGRVNALAVAFK